MCLPFVFDSNVTCIEVDQLDHFISHSGLECDIRLISFRCRASTAIDKVGNLLPSL